MAATLQQVLDEINTVKQEIDKIKDEVEEIKKNSAAVEKNSAAVKQNSDDLMQTVENVKNDFNLSSILGNIPGLSEDVVEDIPEFIQEHMIFFVGIILIILIGLFSTIGTFVLTFLNVGFLGIVLDKVNQIDLLILQKK